MFGARLSLDYRDQSEPLNRYFSIHVLEFLIAGDQVRLLVFCQRCREAICKRHFVFRFETRRLVSKRPIGIYKLDSQLPQFMDAFVRLSL